MTPAKWWTDDNGIPPCPECWAGKHENCSGQSWDNDADEFTPCPCAERGHETP